jgi:hypothetical protein
MIGRRESDWGAFMPSGDQGALVARVVLPGSPPADIYWVEPGELRANGEFIPAPRLATWDEAGHIEWASLESRDWFFAAFVEREAQPAPNLSPSNPRRGLAVVIAVLVVGVAVFIGGLMWSEIPARRAQSASVHMHVDHADVEKVTSLVTAGFPGWTIEEVLGAESVDEDGMLIYILKWQGREDFRIEELVTFVGHVDMPKARPIIPKSPLKDPATAASFIRAFKTKHPEGGIIADVRGGLDPEYVGGANSRGMWLDISYQPLSEYRSCIDNRQPMWESAAREIWRSTPVNGKTFWGQEGVTR